MSVERSPEMILAAFFLAKFGEGGVTGSHSQPPRELGSDTWREVYERLFRRLADSRDFRTFANSFNQARRYYRDYLAGRGSLTEERRAVLAPWLDSPRDEVWAAVRGLLDPPAAGADSLAEPVLPEEVVQSAGLFEGAVRSITVNAYERNAEARRLCVAHYGPRCAACGFDFGATYGAVADGFIHVHHVKPLSEVGAEYEVDPVADLRPVCPNCHAVIHLGGGCRNIDEVRQMLRNKTGQGWGDLGGVDPSTPRGAEDES